MPVYHTFRVDEYLVGGSRYVISALRIAVGVCHNPLSAFLEVEQGIAYFLHCGISCLQHAGFYIYAFYVVVVLRLLDGRQYVVKSKVVDGVAGELSEDVFLSLFLNYSGQVEHHYGIVAYLLCGFSRGNHANDAYYSHHTGNGSENNQSDDCRKNLF